MKLTEEQFDKIVNTVWALLVCDPPPKKETTKYAIEQILTPTAPPSSAEDLIRGAFGGCTCSEAYTSRNKTDPYCFYCNHADDIKRIMHAYAAQLTEQITELKEEIEYLKSIPRIS